MLLLTCTTKNTYPVNTFAPLWFTVVRYSSSEQASKRASDKVASYEVIIIFNFHNDGRRTNYIISLPDDFEFELCVSQRFMSNVNEVLPQKSKCILNLGSVRDNNIIYFLFQGVISDWLLYL